MLSTPSSLLIVLMSSKISFRFFISLSSFESSESIFDNAWLSCSARLMFSGGFTMDRPEGVVAIVIFVVLAVLVVVPVFVALGV